MDERNEVVDWLDFHRRMDQEQDVFVSRSISSFSLSKSSSPEQTRKESTSLFKKEDSGTTEKRCLPDVVEPTSAVTDKKKGKSFKFFTLRKKKGKKGNVEEVK